MSLTMGIACRLLTAASYLAFAAVLAGCAEARVPVSPAPSGWHSVTTAHFLPFTDLDERTAIAAAQELETTRDALISAAWPSFHFPELARTRVYVLANGLDFERLFSRRIGGLFSSDPPPAFFLYGPPSRWSTRWSLAQEAPSSVLRHEMTHQLAAAVFPRQPRWFAEGIAQFLETIRVTDDGNSVIVGENNAEARASFLRYRSGTLRETLAWRGYDEDMSDAEVHSRYGTAWFLFHWLYNTQPQAFSRYQFAVAQGLDPVKAWRDAFPGFDPDVIEKRLFEYAHHGNFNAATVPLRNSNAHPVSKPMTAADLHAVRAHMAFVAASWTKDGDRYVAEGKREVAAALEMDPTNIDALSLDIWSPRLARRALAQKAVDAHPDDSRAFELLGDVASDVGGKEAAYRRALALAPDDANVLEKLALLLQEDRRSGEALPLALRALKRAPSRIDVNATYAELLYDMQRCEGAVEHEARALDLAAEGDAALRERLSKRLAVMRNGCGDPAHSRRQPLGTAQAVGGEVGPPAAEEAPQDRPTATATGAKRTGLYTMLSGGMGYGAGSYQVETKVDGPFTAVDVSAEAAVGYGIFKGCALALEGGVFFLPGFTMDSTIPNFSFSSTLIAERFGMRADVYPLSSSSFHLSTGIDAMYGNWNSTGNFGDSQSETGFFTHFGMGMLWPLHGGGDIGPTLRAQYGHLASDAGRATFRGATVHLNVVWF